VNQRDCSRCKWGKDMGHGQIDCTHPSFPGCEGFEEKEIRICQRCGKAKVCSIMGKTSDCFAMTWYDGKEQDGYVVPVIGIGGGDYIEFDYCLHCGQIQGDWPVPAGKEKS